MSSAKWRPSCLGLNLLTHWSYHSPMPSCQYLCNCNICICFISFRWISELIITGVTPAVYFLQFPERLSVQNMLHQLHHNSYLGKRCHCNGFPSQWASDVEFWCFRCCQFNQIVELRNCQLFDMPWGSCDITVITVDENFLNLMALGVLKWMC